MKVTNSKLFINQVMNQNLASPAIQLDNIVGYAVQAVYAGTPTGSLKLQCSNDPILRAYDVQPETPANWDDIADSSFAVTSAGIYVWNVRDVFYTFVRLVYTDSSGGASTAILNANINCKGV